MGFIPSNSGRICRVAILVLIGAFASPLLAEEQNTDKPIEFMSSESAVAALTDYGTLSIEELMKIQVTSVAGYELEWFDTPAAFYVITNEDMRRSGHQSIAEALRMVPGVNVARTDSSGWAIGMRGFHSGFANKSLLLIDGRTTYDLLFGGTFWDVQDVLLEDLDRIEVIRGPGATLWGANAVNGVINVTTKSARDTQGLYTSVGGGTLDRYFGEMRYGGQISEDGWYRVWGKYADHDHFDSASGANNHDEWDMAQGGFRLDFEPDDETSVTIDSGLYYSDRIGELVSGIPTDGRAAGGHFLTRLHQKSDQNSNWTLQAYYDRTERRTSDNFEVDRNTFDIDFRQYQSIGDRHEFLWGLGYRYTQDDTQDRTSAAGTLAYDPESREMHTISAFLQDTWTLVPDEIFIMLGSKFEHNDHTGFEFQPSGRIWWTPDDKQTLWAALSRPVRVPSRTDDDLQVTSGPITFTGNPGLEAETLIAYELGYRRHITETLTADIALFANDYNDLLALTPAPNITFTNDGSAETAGIELLIIWRCAENWKLTAGYSYLYANTVGQTLDNPEGDAPQHMAQLISHYNIRDDLELNSALYYVDHLRDDPIDSYFRLDIGITWRLAENVEFSLWGQNLLDPSHPEFGANPAEVPRSAYVQMKYRF